METGRFLFLTSNVGSLFENENILAVYINEINAIVSDKQPCFVAIHFQEIGGKDAAGFITVLDKFFKLLIRTMMKLDFNRQVLFADQDYTEPKDFVSIGSAYFIHKSVDKALLYNYNSGHYSYLTKILVYTGNIKEVQHIYFQKFPIECLENEKSRKGFAKTRWKINEHVFECVNAHLNAAMDNLVGFREKEPDSANKRKLALQIVIDSFSKRNPISFLIFGDFNHRLYMRKYIEENNLKELMIDDKTYEYHNEKNEVCFKVGPKIFSRGKGIENVDFKEFLKYNLEWKEFSESIDEQEIKFNPTYQFKDDLDATGTEFCEKRPFAWTDRVFYSKKVNFLDKILEYNCLGLNKNVGDHKFVYLYGEAKFQPLKEYVVINDHVLRDHGLMDDDVTIPSKWNVLNFGNFHSPDKLPEDIKALTEGPQRSKK